MDGMSSTFHTVIPTFPLRTLRLSLLIYTIAAGLQAQSVLFVGNSFTHGPRGVGVGIAVELNKEPAGGVPALFQALAAAGGKNPSVTMETADGATLQIHYETKRELIDKPWDIVVLQDQSSGPLHDADGSTVSLDSFRNHVTKLKALFVAKNPEVKLWLYETWALPELVIEGSFATMEEMQAGLRSAYSTAAKENALQGWVPVGTTFVAATKQGLADNPATPVVEGPLHIWGWDNWHQNVIGAYLSALLFYGRIYDADPRDIPADNAAAAHIKLSAEDAQKLHILAFEQLQTAK